jgi:hypothetical protein
MSCARSFSCFRCACTAADCAHPLHDECNFHCTRVVTSSTASLVGGSDRKRQEQHACIWQAGKDATVEQSWRLVSSVLQRTGL